MLDMDKSLERLIKQSNLTEGELRRLLQHNRHVPQKVSKHTFGDAHFRVGVVSDPHIGSKYFNLVAFEASVRKFKSDNVDMVLCPGDIIEGMSGRDGHVYELTHIGYSAQLDYACELLKQYGKPFYFTTGNHDEWAKKKANGGLLIGPEIEKRVKDTHFLGEYDATMQLNGVRIDLMHRGNTAYALSYPGQKLINAIEGGNKPEIIFNGHLHKSVYMFYRNIHFFESGTLQNQSEFMRMKGSPAMVGFWVVDIWANKSSITGLQPVWHPIYLK
jgi:predicted phosphodiesterase